MLQTWTHLNVLHFTTAEFQIRSTILNFRTISKETADSFQFQWTPHQMHSQPGAETTDYEGAVDDFTQFIIHDDT